MVTKNTSAPPQHIPRIDKPKRPSPMGQDAQNAVARIAQASEWKPHLAIMEIKTISTMNLHPAVAHYKVEMLEYLGTLQE